MAYLIKRIFFMCSLRVMMVPICAIVICDSDETRYSEELGIFLNYTKCKGQVDEFINRTFELPIDVLMLDLSGVGMGVQQVDYLKYICGFTNLTFLNISENEIVGTQDLFCSIPSLKVLDLSRNAITVIRNTSFTNIMMLTHLYLNGNYITVIESSSFSALKELRTLDLSDNNILGLQIDTLSGLTNLKYIKLANNKISFILAGAFSGLQSLESIDLSRNSLSDIDKFTFIGVERLQRLLLKENLLTASSFKFLSIFQHLSITDVSKNLIETLETGSFFQVNTTKIVLSYSPSLKAILRKSFASCPFLETVDLSHSHQLFYIHSKAFQVDSLKHIDISCSSLEYLHVESLENQTLITLNDTNLQCDCLNVDFFNSRLQVEGLGPRECRQNLTELSNYQNQSDIYGHFCAPKIISNLREKYILSVGQRKTVGCFAVGKPWPDVSWIRALWNGTHDIYETVTTNHWLKLHIMAVNQGGKYGCIATAMGLNASRFFTLQIKSIDIGVVILTRDPTSIVITWNTTHHRLRHVVLYREYEETLDYHVQFVKDYWRVYKLSDLKPETLYEICIGSALDMNDKNCVKTSTTFYNGVAGIHTDVGVVVVLSIAGLTFGFCFFTTLYKCIKKVKGATKPVYMVNSLSRDSFSETKGATFTYENHFTDFIITEDEAKTEL